MIWASSLWSYQHWGILICQWNSKIANGGDDKNIAMFFTLENTVSICEMSHYYNVCLVRQWKPCSAFLIFPHLNAISS